MHIPTPHFAFRLEHQEKNLETKFNIVAGAGVKSEQEVMLAIHHHYRISREKNSSNNETSFFHFAQEPYYKSHLTHHRIVHFSPHSNSQLLPVRVRGRVIYMESCRCQRCCFDSARGNKSERGGEWGYGGCWVTWNDKCMAEVEMTSTWFDMEHSACPS